MKKLAILAASAAMVLGAFADAQVYEMTITVKSTLAKSGSVTPVVCDTPADETGLYRKQSTVKIKGLFWGCDCETIADPQPVANDQDVFGYIFWNETTREVIAADFSWKTLNRIDKKLKKAEGSWVLSGDDEFYLVGAGFGTVKDEIAKAACTFKEVILTPMSGNVAGWMTMSSTIVSKGKADVCKKCQTIEGSDDLSAIAPGWSLCWCSEDSELTAISGTWKLKYLAAASKKWKKSEVDGKITEVYSFPSYVRSYIESL